MKYDFSGWATRNNLLCSDGRTIIKDAFKDNDGQTVPLVWNHQHNDPLNVLGHALLENRDDGVYAYCTFNNTEAGKNAKQLVEHGDVSALSIYANQLRQKGGNVLHGAIREVSLVLAGANPGAFIDSVMQHGEESDEEAIIYTGEDITLSHRDDVPDFDDSMAHADNSKEGKDMDNKNKPDNGSEDSDKTVQDIIDSMTEEQQDVLYALIGQALDDSDDSEEDNNMKHNVFDNDNVQQDGVLSHSDQETILNLAKSNGVGSFRDAIEMYAENNDCLSHGIDDIESLFPDYENVRPGAPEFVQRDQGWVTKVMADVAKSPFSRIRTRQADITGTDLRALGYQKGKYKHDSGNIKLLKRTTDPQTVYRKDALNRDDIIDITDFDVVEYQYQVMKQNLNEELALAFMIGDGREDGDEMKIDETHIRPIWHDDELYTIHTDVDVKTAKTELQGSNTGSNFGENYIYAEAIISAALYSREQYKGSGNLDFYCTPHLLNVMLLARDLNGRRIYTSKSDLEAALNVRSIQTVEQFEGKTRTVGGKTKKLLGLFVNLSDYQVGSTKGGEITRFSQFDIDFNQEKYLIETRLSGALTRVKSAIALEEDVTE